MPPAPYASLVLPQEMTRRTGYVNVAKGYEFMSENLLKFASVFQFSYFFIHPKNTISWIIFKQLFLLLEYDILIQ